MSTNITSTAEVKPDANLFVLTPGTHVGVIFQAIIGGVSSIALLLLLGHLIAVSFLPLCLPAQNNQEAISYSSSMGASAGDVVSMSALSDRNSNSVIPPKGSNDGHVYEIDLERAGSVTDRRARARARAREILRQNTKYNEEKLSLRMQLGIFVVCMLFSDLIQSVGILIQARWAYLGAVEPGNACWVQAAMLAFGDVATAVWNSIVAIHTFSTVVLGLRMSTLGITIVVFVGWSIPILMNIIGSVFIARTQPTKPYYNVTSAWCFISDDYVIPRIVLHYVPLLFSALIIIIMYVLVSLTMRGNLQVTPVSHTRWLPWFSFSFRRTDVHKSISGNTNQKQVTHLRTLSLKMLWYPCIYTCLILPSSICRMVELRSGKPPLGVLFFAMTLLNCIGLSNVAIYVTTHNIGIHSKRNTAAQTPHPLYRGSQVAVYIDRVTQNDVGMVTIGGTSLGGRDKNIRFEGVAAGDMEGSVGRKSGYDATTSRSSLKQGSPHPDVKSPGSATQFMPNSPRNSTLAAVYHPEYTLRSPPRTRNHSRSLGSVVVDRLGTVPRPQGRHTPFGSSFHEGEQTVARSQSPIRLSSQFEPGIRPLSRIDPAVRNYLLNHPDDSKA